MEQNAQEQTSKNPIFPTNLTYKPEPDDSQASKLSF